AAAMPRKVGWSARGVSSPLGRPKAAEAMALPWLPKAPRHMAPSMRLKARSRPPASHTAIFILAPIWFAFSMAPAITRLASARVRVTRSILSGQERTRMLALVESTGDLVAQILLQRNAASRYRSATGLVCEGGKRADAR